MSDLIIIAGIFAAAYTVGKILDYQLSIRRLDAELRKRTLAQEEIIRMLEQISKVSAFAHNSKSSSPTKDSLSTRRLVQERQR